MIPGMFIGATWLTGLTTSKNDGKADAGYSSVIPNISYRHSLELLLTEWQQKSYRGFGYIDKQVNPGLKGKRPRQFATADYHNGCRMQELRDTVVIDG